MDRPLNVMMIGAHPDDCEIKSAGLAASFRALGHRVKFVSATNGVTGHQSQGGATLARRRLAETQAVARTLDIEYEVLDIPSGDLEPTLANRRWFIRLIREWETDLLFTHRPNDYHPDHRYTSQLVCDSSYVVTVPSNTPLAEPLAHMPVICYFADTFQRPYPFSPTVLVDITARIDQKVCALHCHTSQMYEWLPWNKEGGRAVPETEDERLAWLFEWRTKADAQIADRYRDLARELYGAAATDIQYAEAFEACEYGRPLTAANRRDYFPMLPEGDG